MRLVALSVLSLLSLAGCNQPGEAPASTDAAWPALEAPEPQKAAAQQPLPKACDLVSAEQAQALLQQPVSLMSDEPENCMYASAGNPGQITMLMVTLVQNDDLAMAEQVYQSLTGLQGDLSAAANAQLGQKTKKSGQELDDLGDAAWLSGSNMDIIATKQILLRKGTVILHIHITGMSKTSKLEGFDARLIALARNAEPRL